MTAQDQPRGSREAYERLSDPAMYWTQVNAQPIREPIRREPPPEEEPTAQFRELPENHPYRELSPDWKPDGDPEETRLAELIPYEDERPLYADSREQPAYDEPKPTYDDQREQRTDRYRIDGYEEVRDRYDDEELTAHDRFGGVNWGAGFFGWLVSVSFTVFLAAVLGVVVTVLRRTVPAVSAMADTRPGATAIALAAGGFLVLMIGYYTGGYVAGRMSRFDGGRQGTGVWVTGLLMTAVALGFGLFFGSAYHLLDRVDLPALPVPAGSLGLARLVGAVAALLGSLLMAIWGGKVGRRYHEKVDEYL